MKVLLYCRHGTALREDVDMIMHRNAISGLCVHECVAHTYAPGDDRETIDVQMQVGQVATLGAGVLSVWQIGHVETDDPVVWACGGCLEAIAPREGMTQGGDN